MNPGEGPSSGGSSDNSAGFSQQWQALCAVLAIVVSETLGLASLVCRRAGRAGGAPAGQDSCQQHAVGGPQLWAASSASLWSDPWMA